jgi:hypothetical protein
VGNCPVAYLSLSRRPPGAATLLLSMGSTLAGSILFPERAFSNVSSGTLTPPPAGADSGIVAPTDPAPGIGHPLKGPGHELARNQMEAARQRQVGPPR